MKKILLFSITVAFVLACHQCNAGFSLFSKSTNKGTPSGFNIPKPFKDDLLPSVPPYGVEFGALGKIVKLSSFFKAKQVATKFTIITRRGTTRLEYGSFKNCYEENCSSEYQYNLASLALSGYDPSLRTIIMVPGFLTDDKPEWILKSAEAWLKLEDVNVIMVTWKDGNRPFYHGAVANTPVVARQISILLYYLAEINGASLKDDDFLNRVQLVGHSLGAHISGFVGKDFKGKLGRITGLDPAGPDFCKMTRSHRLDRFDAKLVTIIHSNRGALDYFGLAKEGIKVWTKGNKDKDKDKEKEKEKERKGKKEKKEKDRKEKKETEKKEIDEIEDQDNIDEKDSPSYFGIDQQVGDIDFYANDGSLQPGCDDPLHICDHGRSTEIYQNILDYTFELRSKNSDNPLWFKQTRPLAFKTSDFAQFSSGETFYQQCPGLLEQKYSSGQEMEKELQNCAIPLDFVSPVDEYVKEVKEVFNIDFDKTNYNPNNQFMFKTLPTSPFVGEHYLLKLELDKAISNWDKTCGLSGQLIMADGTKVQVDVDRDSQLIDDENFYGLAMPFINPMKTEAPYELNKILNKNPNSPIVASSLAKVIPSEIRLSISSQPEQLTKSASQNSDKKLDSSSSKDVTTVAPTTEITTQTTTTTTTTPPPTVDRCIIKILSTKVEPIISEAKSLVGLYDKPKRSMIRQNVPAKKHSWKRFFHIKKSEAKTKKTDDVIVSQESVSKRSDFNQLIEASQTDILCSNTTPSIMRKINRLMIKTN